MSKIVAISGRKRSGKDTAGEVFINNGYVKYSFAAPLKELCETVFPEADVNNELTRDHIRQQPLIIEETHISNLIFHISNLYPSLTFTQSELIRAFLRDKGTFVSGREILEFVGTTLCRDIISKNFWLDIMEQRLTERTSNVVITDCRFKNERNLVRKLGGTNIYISRPEVERQELSISELDLGDEIEYDMVVFNDTDRDSYLNKVSTICNNITKKLVQIGRIWE